MGLVPDISGIYREDLLKLAGRQSEKPNIDGVLLSHAHADHADYISFLHEDIPVYMGKACHLILRALEERSPRTIEREILNYKPRPYNKNDKPINRKIESFTTGDKFKIGSLEVEPIHVDHSVPGAYGFIIYSSEGPIVYTGDIRLHGTNPQMTRDFIEKAREVRPIAVIAEGTRIMLDAYKSPSSNAAFLEKELKATTKPWKIVVTTTPLYTSPSRHDVDKDQNNALQPLLDKYGVDLVMWGDNHNYERIKLPNKHTVFIQSDTAGRSHYEFEGQIKESVYQNDNDYGFTKIIINDKSLMGQFITHSGKILDDFSIVK